MRINRLEHIARLQELRESTVIIYVTGDRPNAETNISGDILPIFTDHLDAFGDVPKISLYLYSNGGNTLSGWSLVNLLRSFCKDLEVIIPSKCQSTATLIALGADRIVMTKQATLGPIDPSTNGPMNPQVMMNGQPVKVPVSVEHVNSYLDMAKEDLKIHNESELKDIYLKLSDHIHPLSLGSVYKAKAQIKMLAEKLLKYHEIAPENVSKVISFLCSESGSHDYTIYRKEAKEELGLNIDKPDDGLYAVIKSIYQDIEEELELRNTLNPNIIIGPNNSLQYSLRRALIESIQGGTDTFISEGIYGKVQVGPGQFGIQDNRTFEGWRHEND